MYLLVRIIRGVMAGSDGEGGGRGGRCRLILQILSANGRAGGSPSGRL